MKTLITRSSSRLRLWKTGLLGLLPQLIVYSLLCSQRIEALPANEPVPNPQLANAELENRVNALLQQLSLEEKVGQLTQYSAGALTGPGTGRDDYNDLIAQGQIGSLFNVVGPKLLNRYQHIAMDKTAHHIPLLFGLDVLHGHRTIFPVPLALASSFDPDLVQRVSHLAAQEASEDGVRWVFAPMVDVCRDPRWGRIVEGSGEDTWLDCILAKAYINGFQGDDLSKPGTVAACVKHYAAYGAPTAGREYNTVDMSELTLREVYLPPYRAAINAGAATVMSAFNPLNGVPASANHFTLTQILRNEWNFKGFVVSDFNAVQELIPHGVALDDATAAQKAINAGVDMDMMADEYRTQLVALVRSGRVSQQTLDEAVRRVLRVKFAMGLFDHPYSDENLPGYQATVEKRKLVRDAAEETTVLLRNELMMPQAKPILPLSKSVTSIGLIGPMADSRNNMLGSWSAAGNAADVVTLKSALERRCVTCGSRLIYAPGTQVLTDSQAGFEEALNVARQSDVVILALGETASEMTGEAAARTRLDLPGNQEALLKAVMRLNKPTVLILFTGRPLAITWAASHVPAILEAWYPGIEAGPAVVDILFGETNPSAKLTATFPRSVGQVPIYYDALPTGRPPVNVDLTHPPAGGGEKYFSRYIDETNAPLYPFGYGLSYTQFSTSVPTISQTQVSSDALTKGTRLRVTVEVKNTGQVRGVEITQLYIRNTGSNTEQPVRQLRGFRRVPLDPGQSAHVEFDLGFDELSHLDPQYNPIVEPSRYQIWVGDSSETTNGTQLEVVP